jgi:hypothetical protein
LGDVEEPFAQLQLYGRAASGRWNLSDAERAEGKRVCLRVMRNPKASERNQLYAVRTLALLDALDAKRERTEVVERGQEIDINLAAMRASLKTAEGQAALQTLCGQLNDRPAEGPTENPPGPPP